MGLQVRSPRVSVENIVTFGVHQIDEYIFILFVLLEKVHLHSQITSNYLEKDVFVCMIVFTGLQTKFS